MGPNNLRRIMPNSLPNKVLAWLETQGYPLEMRVSRAFQQGGFHVVQSDYYRDRETEELREVDVVAGVQKRIGKILLRVTCVIECKSSSSKPWILFASDRKLSAPARVTQRAGNYLAQAFLDEICKHAEVQSLPILQVPARPAYGMTQAFTSGADVCYAATMSVANAALGYVYRDEPITQKRSAPDLLEVVFPIIVTEAPLFSAYLEEESSISLTEENSGLLLWRKELVGMPHTIVHVVTAQHLKDFVDSASASAQRLIELCEGELRPKLAQAHKRWRAD